MENAERLAADGSSSGAAQVERLLRQAIEQGPPFDLARIRSIERLLEQAWRIRSESWQMRAQGGKSYDASGAAVPTAMPRGRNWEA